MEYAFLLRLFSSALAFRFASAFDLRPSMRDRKNAIDDTYRAAKLRKHELSYFRRHFVEQMYFEQGRSIFAFLLRSYVLIKIVKSQGNVPSAQVETTYLIHIRVLDPCTQVFASLFRLAFFFIILTGLRRTKGDFPVGNTRQETSVRQAPF